MPLLVVCDEGHARLAEPWERDEAPGGLGACDVCGATLRVQDHSGQDEALTGEAIPGYEILGPLQGGVMAGVYKARHRRSGRLVALKVGLTGPDAPPGGRGRIRREARTLLGLDHPHVVRIQEVGEAADLAYISMEWLPGGTLADRLCGGPLPMSEAVGLAARLADAAHHAHGRRVVHRDVRPSNVVFSGRGEPVLGDFGIARRLDRRTGRPATGRCRATPGTWPPSSGPTWPGGSAVDVHGLGAVLYHALTGRPPFRDACLLERLRTTRLTVPPPNSLRPSLPPALDRICLRCLSPVPGERYATAGELAVELRGVYGAGGSRRGYRSGGRLDVDVQTMHRVRRGFRRKRPRCGWPG